MRKFNNTFRRLLSFLLVTVMLAAAAPAFLATEADAANIFHTQDSYEIAIVYDNSASMYGETPGYEKYWCRAKYAMEIFASMLDYSTDKLSIFPMWPVTTDGSTDAAKGQLGPIHISSEKDIAKITNMYTVEAGSTPIAPVFEASDYLKKSNATNKWIVILTDGAFNRKADRQTQIQYSADTLKDELLSVATGGVNVQYLGFGGAMPLTSSIEKNFYADTSSDTSLKDDLIDICNKIFERDEMPLDGRLNGKTLDLDLSMKKLIVFVQGSGANIESLTDSSGKTVGIVSNPGQRKYSTVSGMNYLAQYAKVDDTLAGQVVTFGSCPKGKYTLNYSGSDKVQIFYEPDVDLDVTLTDSEGTVFTEPSDAMIAGEYTVNSIIVDKKTGEDVTKHPLMKNATLKTLVKGEKDSKWKEYPNGSKINFDPETPIDLVVEGKYLEDYTITTRGNPNFSWLTGLKFPAPGAILKLNAEVTQEDSLYKLKSYESWKPIKVTLTVDGQPMTEDQLSRTKLTMKSETGVSVNYERIPGEIGFYVNVGRDEGGKYVQPAVGKHEVEIMATYTDEYGKNTSKKKDVKFEVEAFSFSMDAKVMQDDGWYVTTKHGDWKPVRVDVAIDGEPMTDSQLERVKLTMDGKKKIEYYYEIIPGESALNIYIGHNKDGKYADPDTGKYKQTVTAVYVDGSGIEASAEKNVSFELNAFSKIAIFLMWLIAIIVLILLWLAFMLQKVLPKRVDKDKGSFWCMSAGDLGDVVDFQYNRKSKYISVAGPRSVNYDEQCSASFTIKAVDNRFTPSKSRRFSVVAINSACSRVKLGSVEYIKYNGKWIKKTQLRNAENGKTIEPMDQVLSCSPRFDVIAEPNGYEEGILTCKTKTKK